MSLKEVDFNWNSKMIDSRHMPNSLPRRLRARHTFHKSGGISTKMVNFGAGFPFELAKGKYRTSWLSGIVTIIL